MFSIVAFVCLASWAVAQDVDETFTCLTCKTDLVFECDTRATIEYKSGVLPADKDEFGVMLFYSTFTWLAVSYLGFAVRSIADGRSLSRSFSFLLCFFVA